MKHALSIAVFAFSSFSQGLFAQTLNLPLQLDYALINKLVSSNLYKGTGNSAEVWHDGGKCSSLKLANLKIDGKDEQIRLANDVQVQFGTKLGGQCIPLLNWQGVLETLQKPVLNADHTVLSLPITQAIAYDQQGRQLNIDKLQDLLKRVVEPKLAELSIDLNRVHQDMARNANRWLPEKEAAELSKTLNTLTFSSATANSKGIALQLGMDSPTQTSAQAPAPLLTANEQKQWQTLWQSFEKSLAQSIQGLGKDPQNQALQNSLNSLLQGSHQAFQAGLNYQGTGNDPVRAFFSQSWETLAPQLKQLSQHMPGLDGFNYLSLLAATDVLYEVENKIAPLGITFTSDGLRRLARMLIAGKQEQLQTKR